MERISDLTLRAAHIEDAEAICAITALPGFLRGTLRPPFPAIAGTRKWLESVAPDDLNIVALTAGTLVGNAFCRRFSGRRGHSAELGMGVHDDYCRRGVGAALLGALVDAADRWLAIDRLQLTVFADNAPAKALYEKFGFVLEGVMKRYAFRDGVYVDALCMARLRG